MKIILTGASGFLGSILKNEWLKHQHEVITMGRAKSNHIICDLSDKVDFLPGCDMVVHAASKAHTIPSNKKEEQLFFDVNVKGTHNLLQSLEQNNAIPKTFIYISSVSVYGVATGNEIDETHELKATDAYGKSKIDAEILVKEWCISKNIDWFIFRLPLIAGPDPIGNLGDMIKAMNRGYYFSVGKGAAVKSIVGARELAKFIEKLSGKSGIYNLVFKPHPSLRQIELVLANAGGHKIRSIPKFIAILLAKVGDFLPFIPLNSRRLDKITNSLTFSDSKARAELGWSSNNLSLKQTFD